MYPVVSPNLLSTVAVLTEVRWAFAAVYMYKVVAPNHLIALFAVLPVMSRASAAVHIYPVLVAPNHLISQVDWRSAFQNSADLLRLCCHDLLLDCTAWQFHGQQLCENASEWWLSLSKLAHVWRLAL
jgi:hypothetical protein